MKIRVLSTRDQLRELGNATAAGLFGAFLGLLLGFGDLGGVVWYDIAAGVRLAAGGGALFFCLAIFCAIVDLDGNDN